MPQDLNSHFIKSKYGNGKIYYFESSDFEKPLPFFIEKNKKEIEEILLKYGGILFRGYKINSLAEFNEIASSFIPHLIDYSFRSTPRTKLEEKVYTSTEYPSDRFIQFHNECSYSRHWPAKIMFFCMVAPEKGGETALADSRYVYNKINPEIRDIFNKKELFYVRNYIQGLDMSWQEVFQTDKKEEVEKYCAEENISCEWKDGKIKLKTKQKSQASFTHPITKEVVWFNQAHLFHLSSLEEKERLALLSLIGTEEDLPRNVFYGDETLIQDQIFDHIRQIYETERIEFQWRVGDLLLLDNRLMAHSRNPFEGKRKIVVAMGES